MKNSGYHKTLLIIFCTLLAVIPAAIKPVLYSQYVGDYNIENKEDAEDAKKAVKMEEKKDEGLPPHIAYNIKAVKIPYMNDSIRLSWNINPNYDDQFIIGKSDEIIDTPERALAADSVTIITSKSKNIYIDQGLKPGNYYYVIVSKGKIHEKDLELYRDVNFTSFPVIIDVKDEKVTNVTSITAKSIGSDRIMVTWNKVSSKGFVYSVYRANYIIDDQNKLTNAKRVGVIIDNDEFIDENIKDKGDLYYAVSIKDTSGTENYTPLPNESYTTKGVKFIENLVKNVSGIESAAIDSRSIRLKWKYSGDKVDTNISGFDIYRSAKAINTSDIIDSAVFIKTVSRDIFEYVDMVAGSGSYYYAVFVKFNDGITNITLEENKNYTTTPVIMSEEFSFVSINAFQEDGKIKIEWQYTGVPGERYFRLFRTGNIVNKPSAVRNSEILQTVDIADKGFFDNRPLASGAYYGLLPEKDDSGFKLVRGKTITGKPARLKTGSIVPEQTESIESGDIDEILKRTFFKGYYLESLKELKNYIKNSDNKREVAKAQLFIGRSYIEMKEYRKAVNFLVQGNVKKYYSNEAKFWQDFAMMRISR